MPKPDRTCYFRNLAVAALLSLSLPSAALAHARLVSSLPGQNSAIAPVPTELRLKFSEGVELKFTKVTLTGPQLKVIATGPARLAPGDDSLIVVPITGPLTDGKYTVDWQAVSSDGHRTSGAYVFELAK